MASFTRAGEDAANVGILAIETYFPSLYVAQTDMERANGVSEGKYTIGLGQDAMAFTGDREDINSISLTVVQSLLEKYRIGTDEVGRLEVGTESLVDKSKSTKTVLMSLFEGNTDIEGATVINACYGGTAALLNALAWVDSSGWDGRYAIVVAADIAVYADGPARPTGGCGAVAMLVGRNAPLQIDLRTRATHATHVWDFFKPKLHSEYPEVNGALSQTCYLRALDDCYTRFLAKKKAVSGAEYSVANADYCLFHSPYNKLVRVVPCGVSASVGWDWLV
jgi:hydroxymethylglutaryl-CoA synthase